MKEGLRERLKKLLIDSKKLTKEQVQKALEIQSKEGGSLSKILVKGGLITETDLMVLLSKGLKIPPIALSKYKIDSEVISIIPEKS